jgi:hypothetical protein
MPSYVTPKKNTAFRFFVSLTDQANTKLLKANPTLATGDVKVSKDGGALANITTLPSAISSSRLLQVDLSATEMDADNVSIVFSDATGAEWCDVIVNIQTTARQIDDLLPTASYTAPLTAGQVNAEVVDALATDTYAEPGQGNPAATTSLAAKINYLYKAWRNRKKQKANQFELFNDSGTVVDQKASLTEDVVNSVTTLGEIETGP